MTPREKKKNHICGGGSSFRNYHGHSHYSCHWENTVPSLKEWFSILPLPEEIQSDNGSHFTVMVIQDWAKEEEIQWVFHTPCYLQANGIAE